MQHATGTRSLTFRVGLWYNEGEAMQAGSDRTGATCHLKMHRAVLLASFKGKEVHRVAYKDFPDGLEGQKKRKAFFLSTDGIALIADWRRHGIPLTKIATEYIGISKTAFWGWYRESDDLKKACAISKDITDSNVEDALYRRACGYDYTEDTWELVEGQLTKTKIVTKHVPPDVKAILAWLYNRRPNVWRSLQEPLESTQYVETVKNVLVAMKEVAETGSPKLVEVTEDADEI